MTWEEFIEGWTAGALKFPMHFGNIGIHEHVDSRGKKHSGNHLMQICG